jgi:CO/xanthine dehydrogenase Mo-binding subunit
MAWENYGFAYAIDQRAGVDDRGGIVAWDYEAWFASQGGRPGYDTPGNVVTGTLAGYAPAPFRPAGAAEPPGEFRNGSNAAPSYIAGRTARRAGGAGTVTSERVLTHTVHSPFYTGPLRSPSRLQNTFAHESFVDEIAAHVKADPVEYRLRHLSDARLKDVVNAAAKAAGWQARPSPAAGQSTGLALGRGVACVAYEGDNGYAALVAEVAVDRATGAITVKRFVAAHDCGPISNPDGVRNQIEGGALQGLSRALGEEVTWDDRRVTSVDWRSYHTLPLGFAVPTIDSVLLDRVGVPATGAGETIITVVAAAVGNAVFDATGARLREVPFTRERVKRALDLVQRTA